MKKLLLAALCLTAGLFAATPLVRAAAPPTNATESDPLSDRRTPVVRAVEKAAPAVVNISTKQVRMVRPNFWMDVPDMFKREFGDLFKPRRQVTGSLGSGVIISPQGYIVTNAHVVEQADEIIVTLADETQHKAELVSADPEGDLAIIKMETDKPVAAIRIGTSSDLMIGETVIAVGNPFGYQHSVTTGVVSAVDRTLEPSPATKREGLIQTDAPINPGNSGGPLLNIRGELIGINTAIRAGAQGLGFAIPVDKVRAIMIGLLSVRGAGQPWHGIKFDAAERAPVVLETEKGSPAAKAGMLKGDRIEALGGRRFAEVIELETTLLDRKIGDAIDLGVRREGRSVDVKFTLAEAPKPDGVKLAKAIFGLHVQELKPELARSMKLAVERGLLVGGVDPDSPAAAAGFVDGDVVVQIDQYRIYDCDSLGNLLMQVKKGDRILFYVVRGKTVARAIMAARAREE
ncbi:MAG: trypsin-like peptidase domain-containing protein [Planctomycetota bacterium]|nr:trypsin-like peptidase domain-containing protein [Planctomycetota bacterium]